MDDFYFITPRYVGLAAIGLLTEANQHATRFSAKTAKEAEMIGDEMAAEMYMQPDRVNYRIVSVAQKMRIDGQPELFEI